MSTVHQEESTWKSHWSHFAAGSCEEEERLGEDEEGTAELSVFSEKAPMMLGHLLPLSTDSLQSGSLRSLLDGTTSTRTDIRSMAYHQEQLGYEDPSSRLDDDDRLDDDCGTISRLAGIDSRDEEESSFQDVLQGDTKFHDRATDRGSSSPRSPHPDDSTDYDSYFDSLHSRLNSTHFQRNKTTEDYIDSLFEKIENLACDMDGEPETIKDILDEVFEFLEDAICGRIARQRNATCRRNFEAFLQQIDRLAALVPEAEGGGGVDGGGDEKQDLLDILCQHLEKLTGDTSYFENPAFNEKKTDSDLFEGIFSFFDGCRSQTNESHHTRDVPRKKMPVFLSESTESRDGIHNSKHPLFKISEEGSMSTSSDQCSTAKTSATSSTTAPAVDKERARQERIRRNDLRRLRGNIHGHVSTRDVIQKVEECRDTVHDAMDSAGEQFSTAGCQLSIFDGVELEKLWEAFVLGPSNCTQEGDAENPEIESGSNHQIESSTTDKGSSKDHVALPHDESEAMQIESIVVYDADIMNQTSIVSQNRSEDEEEEDIVLNFFEAGEGNANIVPAPEVSDGTNPVIQDDQRIEGQQHEEVEEEGYDVVLATASEETLASGCGSGRSVNSRSSPLKRFQLVNEMKKFQAELRQKLTPNSTATAQTCDESLSVMSDMDNDNSGRRIKAMDSESSRFGRMEIMASLSVHEASRFTKCEQPGCAALPHRKELIEEANSLHMRDLSAAHYAASLDSQHFPSLVARPDEPPEPASMERRCEFDQASSLDGNLAVVVETVTSIASENDFGKASNRSNRSILVRESTSASVGPIDEMPSIPYIPTPESIIEDDQCPGIEDDMPSIPSIPTPDSMAEKDMPPSEGVTPQSANLYYSMAFEVPANRSSKEEESSYNMKDQTCLILTDSTQETSSSIEDSHRSDDETDDERSETSSDRSRLMRARAMPSCISLSDDAPDDELHMNARRSRDAPKSVVTIPETSSENNSPQLPTTKASSASSSAVSIPAGISWYGVLQNVVKGGAYGGKWFGSHAMKAMMLLVYLSVTVASSANETVKAHMEKRKRQLAEKMKTNRRRQAAAEAEASMVSA